MDTDDTAETGGEPEATGEAQPDELTPAQLAALEAARAAKKARKTQRKAQAQADRARRLAEEYARLAGEDEAAAAAPVVLTKPGDEPAAVDEAEPEPESAPLEGAEPEPEPALVEGAEPEPGPAAEPASGLRVPLITAAAVLAVCVAFAVAALVVFLTKDHSSGSADANIRDDVLQQARQDFVVLNTMDYRNVDEGLKRWADASTGTLHNQVVGATAVEKKHLTQAQDVASAVVVAAAITSLDPNDGSASVIASVDVTVKHVDKQAVVKRERLKGQMTRVGSVWKVSSLESVPVSTQ